MERINLYTQVNQPCLEVTSTLATNYSVGSVFLYLWDDNTYQQTIMTNDTSLPWSFKPRTVLNYLFKTLSTVVHRRT